MVSFLIEARTFMLLFTVCQTQYFETLCSLTSNLVNHCVR